MEYNFKEIETRARKYWKEHQVYQTKISADKPKYYVLDMFPYPSGAGLHVGHPLGYIASDIISRYKRMKGFNVLHPMGFDSFGLPAEQYAIETGQHPAVTTEQNIQQYKSQLDNIGFDYDWNREVRTSDPNYYRWTQWIFCQLFDSWYDRQLQKTRPIADLIAIFEQEGNIHHPAPGNEDLKFTSWTDFNEVARREILMQYRIAYLDYADVWWCEALNTVLANDEVVNGVSERGGHPVERKKMRQWFLRITEYADRLLESLDRLEWSDAMKEMQKNWIGKSVGAEVDFSLLSTKTDNAFIRVFTTRPDTIYGVDFLVLAPEHELISQLVADNHRDEVNKYISYVRSRSERERMAERKVSGVFTGAYASHPLTQKQIPIYVSEYVLSGYGTGAIMAVPAGDERDFAFAKHFEIPITNIFGSAFTGAEAITNKDVTIENSEAASGKRPQEAAAIILRRLESKGTGKPRINFRLRDAGFSRQRYWGEPFPVVYQKHTRDSEDSSIDLPYLIQETELPESLKELPVALPQVDFYEPGPEGQGPLANIDSFVHIQDKNGVALKRETNTMPGFAGSSWYFLRYMDPQNQDTFAAREATDYWNQVDLYIGGTEHAVGHLLYSRMWTKCLYDLGYIGFDEPFKRLLNQGMIQGSSRFVYRLNLKAAEKIVRLAISKYCKEQPIQYDHKIGEVTFDFYLPELNLAIDVTKNNIIKQRVSSFKNNNLPEEYKGLKTIFVTEIEIFDKLRRGKGYCSEWITRLLNGGKDYQSEVSDKEYYFISRGYIDKGEHEDYDMIRTDVNIVDGVELDVHAFRKWRSEYQNAEFILEDGKYICGTEIEKMSKSKYNVVNPDNIVAQYGADTFRMYEMFLGPVEMSKPWDTKGIEGVSRFLKKWFRTFYNGEGQLQLVAGPPPEAAMKVLHRNIRKIEEATERYSFNTAVSQFMICLNELGDLHQNNREVLLTLVRLIAPYAPHIAEYIWQEAGEEGSVVHAPYPVWDEKYLQENSKMYPVAVNGKLRAEMEFDLEAPAEEIEKAVLAHEKIMQYMDGKPLKKFIYVKGRMINVVV